ncbi:MAG: SBBP repeat-containing protein [Candidatus Aegiribacteria sp.]|nr:SBBP repeat-containing protein [Candidatus Aegiribacteria sp.]
MRLIKIIAYLIPIVLFVGEASSDNPVEEWIVYYSGLMGFSCDVPISIALDKDGNIYIAGKSNHGSNQDFTIIKYDTSGTEEWVAIYDGSGFDYPYSTILDSDGNVSITGMSEGSDSGWDYATVKYNSEGLEQWVARYQGVDDNWDISNSITSDENGNIYVTGESDRYPYSGGDTDYDYCTIKYNSSGEEQWVRLYDTGQETDDLGKSIFVGEDGNVYVTGGSYIDAVHHFNFTTIKYDSTGSVQWTADYDSKGNGLDIAYSIIGTADGYLYVGGTCSFNAGGDKDYAVVKYDDDGNEQWVAYWSASYSSFNSMVVDNSGNVYVICSTTAYLDIQKYSSEGNIEWAAAFDGHPLDICCDEAGDVYVTGSRYNGDNYDIVTSKYCSSDGIEQWTVYFNGPDNLDDRGFALALDDSGNIFVTGSSRSNASWDDFVTIKYSQTTGIEGIQEDLQPSIYVYPSPANTYVSIGIIALSDSEVTLSIYGLDGRLVDTILAGHLQEGENTFKWQTSGIPEGIYLLRFQADSFESTTRVVVVH